MLATLVPLFVAGCAGTPQRQDHGKSAAVTHPTEYDVYSGDLLVLEIRDEPGPLVSRLAPPPLPGEKLPMHPFLSATAYAPDHEEKLRKALDESTNLEEYLRKLESLGYRIVKKDPR